MNIGSRAYEKQKAKLGNPLSRYVICSREENDLVQGLFGGV